VVAIEIVPELWALGKNNVSKYGFIKKGVVEFRCGDGSKGFKNKSPYDKILVSASSSTGNLKELKEQLKIGGRMVCPIKKSIWLFIKKSENVFQEKEYPGFIFVPLVQ
jgi:protein-L-isoaspartate(D-aspartate) O-methyltransferase